MSFLGTQCSLSNETRIFCVIGGLILLYNQYISSHLYKDVGIRYAVLLFKGVQEMMKSKKPKGLSMLEVTIAVFILAFGLLGLAGLHLVAMQSDSLGQQATLASNLAKNKLADLQEAEQLVDGTDQYLDKNNGVTYTRKWMVQSDVSQEDLMTVKVQVSWQGSMVDRCVTVSGVIKRT